jgi:hypothetical protein
MMPPLTVWALRLACLHLALGLTVGALMLADKGVAFLPGQGWLSVHFHTMLFGWTIQFVMGVAYWILPTFGPRTNTGDDRLAWAAVILVNAGALLGSATGIFGALPAIAFGLQALAAVSFAAHIWPRVKAFGSA